MTARYITTRSVKVECQQRQIVAAACGLALTVLALVLAARDFYALAPITATLAGGFFGAALMALRIERWLKH